MAFPPLLLLLISCWSQSRKSAREFLQAQSRTLQRKCNRTLGEEREAACPSYIYRNADGCHPVQAGASMKREHWLIPDSPYASYKAYLAATGPSAVITARGMDPDRVLQEVQCSGLRGRGGAGFPTGVKWRTLRQHPCETRSVVCNAAEGEPGPFKDRYLLRRNPYACIEGLLVAAHVIGAREIYIGIRASFTREIERLRSAMAEMDGAGLLADLAM